MVNTNCAEGLFRRLKSYPRHRNVEKTGKEKSGHLLAEFLWTQQISVMQKPPCDSSIETEF